MTPEEELHAVMSLLERLAEPAVLREAARLEEEEGFTWEKDPFFPGVWGLLAKNSFRAAIVVYLIDADFETDMELVRT